MYSEKPAPITIKLRRLTTQWPYW